MLFSDGRGVYHNGLRFTTIAQGGPEWRQGVTSGGASDYSGGDGASPNVDDEGGFSGSIFLFCGEVMMIAAHFSQLEEHSSIALY